MPKPAYNPRQPCFATLLDTAAPMELSKPACRRCLTTSVGTRTRHATYDKPYIEQCISVTSIDKLLYHRWIDSWLIIIIDFDSIIAWMIECLLYSQLQHMMQTPCESQAQVWLSYWIHSNAWCAFWGYRMSRKTVRRLEPSPEQQPQDPCTPH